MSRKAFQANRYRRIAVALAAIGMLGAGAASSAAAATFCVHRAHCHGTHEPSVRAAVAAARANGRGTDRIFVGAGHFAGAITDSPSGPFDGSNRLDLIGVGRRTVLDVGSRDVDLENGSGVRNVAIRGGLFLSGGSADHVSVTGTGVGLYSGAAFRRGAIRVTDGGTGVVGVNGRVTVEDSSIVAPVGIRASGGSGHADPTSAGVVTVRRVRITASDLGVNQVDSISDSVIHIQGPGTAISVSCFGEFSGDPTRATNVTLVGDGSPGSTGAETLTAGGLHACGGAHLELRNSIIRGFAVSLREHRGRSCDPDPSITQDCPPGTHTDNVIAASYSDYDPSRVQNDRPVSVDAGHNVNVDPRFMYAAGGEFRLRYDSPVIDRASDRAPGQLDLGRHRRSVDAHRAGDLIVDMGAFEYQGTGPRPLIGTRRTARAGQRVAFRGDRSSDPDGGRLTYNWHFGDGSASADGAWVTHTFRHPGRYRVYLRITDFAGQQALTSKVIRITR